MWPSVAEAFPGFTERFEGHLSFMYLDVKGLVTTGRGNLIDPVECALVLPWLTQDGYKADRNIVIAEWQMIKDHQDMKMMGGGAFSKVATLHLSEASIDALTSSKCASNENYLKGRFFGWDSMPADAQLGTLSLAWACGPAFNFPKFEAALRAGDWNTCSVECQMNVAGNPGLVPRNAANKQLFLNCLTGGDPSVLVGA